MRYQVSPNQCDCKQISKLLRRLQTKTLFTCAGESIPCIAWVAGAAERAYAATAFGVGITRVAFTIINDWIFKGNKFYCLCFLRYVNNI